MGHDLRGGGEKFPPGTNLPRCSVLLTGETQRQEQGVARTPAWEAAYREYFAARQRPLMRTAYAVLGSWPAAEDAVQTTFTQLYVHWPRIQPGAMDAYARRTVVNTCFPDGQGARSRDRDRPAP
jgi:DNA-directed RNA polymerase specialized sigma24 family protein